MKKQFVATGFVLLSFLFPLKAKATTFDRLYVFGNSLSDNGNLLNLTTAANKLDPTIPIAPPSPPYYQGRFSNGPIWLDDLAPQLGLTTPLIPSTKLAVGGPITLTPSGPTINFNYSGATTINNVDFAFGGAETGIKSNDARLPIGLLTEVNSYIGDLTSQQSADPKALYVVEAGSNDFIDQATAGNQFNTQEAIDNLQTAVTELYAKGARNFFIPNLSDLGKTPLALSRGRAESAILTEVTDTYNAALVKLLNGLSDKYTGINIIPLDVDSLFNQITANPTAFGLTNVTDACLTAVSVCANPNQYFFWDDVHPTAPVQTILANAALAKLNSVSVPEPTSALDILVFAALGASLKLKRQRQKN